MRAWVSAALALVLSACASGSVATVREFVLDANGPVQTRIGTAEPNAWGLNPALNPDVMEAPIREGRREPVCFMSGAEEACFETSVGSTHDFTIVRDGVRYPTRIVGVLDIPAARFSPEYQAANRGQVQILVPEVYEMVNVAIALTDFVARDQRLVPTNNEYHPRMLAHFAPLRSHPFVTALSERMESDIFLYFRLKMNAYAFEFDANGRIVRSSVYDRTGFDGDRTNTLLPLVAEMQSFADASNFRAFYAENRPFYESQISYLRDNADTTGMSVWLQERFPAVRAYDGVKIIFSPLVGSNQSLTTFDYDGYRELQPHVNFPYNNDTRLSPQGQALNASLILFTEMNHGFINPTADGYAAEIDAAIGSREPWADDTKSPRSYPNDMALFNEYMNWGLISLYFHDRMTPADMTLARPNIERNMVEGRGFRKFAEFNAELLRLYTNRAPGQTIADLYPQIIAWFAAETQRAAG